MGLNYEDMMSGSYEEVTAKMSVVVVFVVVVVVVA